ncbi:MAG: hypothetical protein M1592_03905 [Candidatus Thermoplasmatota archaeon]|jgi:VIT1/CCC1 family predicted Fe2+/Mn2+ transporter|nr:hypothetical protein [Candidatus Thermoplasmatota archaeon]
MNKSSIIFPLTLGLSDGIITTLMLISRTVIEGNFSGLGLAFRVAFGSAFVGGFSFFIAEYSRLRGEISRSSRQLMLRSPSYLIKSKIGKDILVESVVGTGASIMSGFTGAMLPLTLAILFPSHGLIAIYLADGAMALLGAGIAKSVHGNYIFWIITMFVLGIVVTVLGNFLNLVS